MRTILLPALLVPCLALAAIPLPSSPSWSSTDQDYSTGGAFADVDTNGFLDFLTSNGNDMAQNRNGAYLNTAGTLETNASWRSSDQGYFGHCYSGDVNNDGLPDLAVAYLGSGGSGELVVRAYRNSGSGLAASPFWKAKDKHSSFDCCLGDVDLDGDLDLAISAGDAYQNETDSVRIYRNNAGTFDTLPCWTAHDGAPSDAVRFCDIDNDGDLDLFVGQVIPTQDRGMVTMYRNNAGVLDPTPAWVARPGVGWVLRLAFGDYDNDGYQDLACASNNQTGEPNSVKVYHNNSGTLDTLAAVTMLRSKRYSSCVAWGDANGDGYADLAAGGWWEPVMVFENVAGVIDSIADWSWIPANPMSLVCEAVLWTDTRNGYLEPKADVFSGNGTRKLFTLRNRPLQFLDSVKVNGTRVPWSGFCYDALAGWVSFASAPPSGTNNVAFHYRHSTHPDLAVTNWNDSLGNHLFRNTTPTALSEIQNPKPKIQNPGLLAFPNPFSHSVALSVPSARPGSTVSVFDQSGRLVRVLAVSGERSAVSVLWNGRDESGRACLPGIYLCRESRTGSMVKLVRLAE